MRPYVAVICVNCMDFVTDKVRQDDGSGWVCQYNCHHSVLADSVRATGDSALQAQKRLHDIVRVVIANDVGEVFINPA